MNFASDNWAGASPRVAAALARAAEGVVPAYGADETTQALTQRLCALFEREVAVFTVPTGTAANALCLAALCPPNGAVLAHEEAHVVGDEGGAPEFYTNGAKVIGLPGLAGKLEPATVEAALARLPGGDTRLPLPSVLTLTQASECGTVYRPGEIAALAAVARTRGMAVHMDGARFANAVAHLGVAPADVTWRAGVDMLSFGGTKNGALMAEAVVFLDPARAEAFDWRRRRGGHVVSKGRLISAQFLALVEDGHWLELAGHANAMAARLAAGLTARNCRVPWPVEANEVFAVLPDAAAGRLREAGARFYPWPVRGLAPAERPAPGETLVRLVASFATGEADVDGFLALAG